MGEEGEREVVVVLEEVEVPEAVWGRGEGEGREGGRGGREGGEGGRKVANQ